MKAFDTDCVVALSDAKSYALLNPSNWNFRKNQARHFDLLKQRGVKYAVYDTFPPRELFVDGGRVYTFLPYVRTVESGDRSSITISYSIALSADGGETWTFVDGKSLTSNQIRLVIPSYVGQPLPLTRWIN